MQERCQRQRGSRRIIYNHINYRQAQVLVIERTVPRLVGPQCWHNALFLPCGHAWGETGTSKTEKQTLELVEKLGLSEV